MKSDQIHKLLVRQCQRIFGREFTLEELDERTKTLLNLVSQTYYEYDEERAFIEHSLDLSCNELYESNSKLNTINDNLQHMVSDEVEKNRMKDLLLMEQSKNAQMGEMLSMIAHQWRQPLGAISSIVSLLQMKQQLNSYDKEFYDNKLANISDVTQHLSQTINDFSQFFKKSDPEDTLIDETIDESIKILHPTLISENIKIETHYTFNKRLTTHPNELKQVILSLIQNSRDAIIERDIKEPMITVRTFNDKTYVYIEIKDNAGGIDEDIIDNIFEPYFTTKSSLNGTGLGLYLSKKIITELLKSAIEVKNIDDGVCFTMRLSNIK